MDLSTLSIDKTQILYKEKKAKPQEVLESMYKNIENFNLELNAFSVLRDKKEVIAEAELADDNYQRGAARPLEGIFVSIKDSFATKGMPNLIGSKIIPQNQEWCIDAPSVTLLKEAGAIIIGKTTMPEFGWKGVTDSQLYGITKNPYDKTKTPGGSSGGAAVATATGMNHFALGTDAGGSVRIPASFCNLVGFKPTQGVIPMHPISSFGSLAHIGPLTRTIADARIAMRVLQGRDLRDPNQVSTLPIDFTQQDSEDNIKIAVSYDLGCATVEPQVIDKIKQFVSILLTKKKWQITENITPPCTDFSDCFDTHWYVTAAELVNNFPKEKQQLLDPGLYRLGMRGKQTSLHEYYFALAKRRQLISDMNVFMNQYDFLITPTMGVLPFELGKDSPTPHADGTIDSWSPFTCLFNLTGQPAVSIPIGFSAEGLPIGAQVVSKHFNDAKLLNFCEEIEGII